MFLTNLKLNKIINTAKIKKNFMNFLIHDLIKVIFFKKHQKNCFLKLKKNNFVYFFKYLKYNYY